MNSLRMVNSSFWLLILLALDGAAQANGDGAYRVLRFPADRAVGLVYNRPATGDNDSRSKYDDWKLIGEARGDVEIPTQGEARLAVSHTASGDLSFLSQLQATDLQMLDLGETNVDDDQLRNVGKLTGLRILNLEQTRITDAGIEHLRGLEQLEDIDLEAFRVNRAGFGVGDAALDILATLPKLEKIDLRLTKITDAGIERLVTLRSLKSLSIPGTSVTDAGVAHLKRLPSLEYLRLGIYDEGIELTDDGLRHVGEITSLKSLDLSGNPITDEGLKHLKNLQQLNDLSLDDTRVTPAGLANLEPLESLENLRCYLGDELDDEAAIALSRLRLLRQLTAILRITHTGVAALATLPHLESLTLRDPGITDAAMEHVARMKSLRSLSLYDCPVTDAGIEKLVALEQLESLTLSETLVTTNGFRQLTKLPRLIRLTLALVDNGDFENQPLPTLEYIGQLSQLEALTISADRLTNKDLSVLSGLFNLKELHIQNMLVDDSGAFYLGGISSLTHLALEDAVVTDAGLVHLSNLRRLEYLHWSGHFTNAGVQQLNKLTSLQRASLSSPYLTEEGTDSLAAALPALSQIDCYPYDAAQPSVSYRETDTFRREGTEQERAKKNALELKPAPPWHLTGWVNSGADGLSANDLRGRVVLIDFWGTWCGPCRVALPKLKRLLEKYPNDLVVIGIHTTSGAEDMVDYVREEGFTWPMACDVEEQTVDAWLVDSYPDLYLLDRQGRVRVADLYQGDLERAVYELVMEKGSAGAAVESESKVIDSTPANEVIR